MTQLLQVRHETTYRYETPVRRSMQTLRMTPQSDSRQTVLQWQLDLPAKATVWQDPYGNMSHSLVLDHPHQAIHICAHGVVQMHGDNAAGRGASDAIAGDMPVAVFLRHTLLTQTDAVMRAFIEPFRAIVRSRPYLGLHDVMLALLERMPYETGTTQVGDSAVTAFTKGKGVCQDHTHVFLACVRNLGLGARYVSGYLRSNNTGHVASHAWAEVWIGERWISFDVSNSMSAGADHIRVAHGLDYLDAGPVRGVRVGGGAEVLSSFAQVESKPVAQQ